MKYFLLVLACYLLLLPCLPCEDTVICSNTSNTAFVGAIDKNHDHQHEEESCSPFCSCACCGQIFYNNFQLVKVALEQALIAKEQYHIYNSVKLSSNFYGNIWQPPKCS